MICLRINGTLLYALTTEPGRGARGAGRQREGEKERKKKNPDVFIYLFIYVCQAILHHKYLSPK